jgi:hypothetical protein
LDETPRPGWTKIEKPTAAAVVVVVVVVVAERTKLPQIISCHDSITH